VAKKVRLAELVWLSVRSPSVVAEVRSVAPVSLTAVFLEGLAVGGSPVVAWLASPSLYFVPDESPLVVA
jgi:hypothetical protein